MIERLLEIPLFQIQSREEVFLALRDYREGRADFADYLIGRINYSAGCDGTATFDRRLTGTDVFDVL